MNASKDMKEEWLQVIQNFTSNAGRIWNQDSCNLIQ
jgi:hypothetical protein